MKALAKAIAVIFAIASAVFFGGMILLMPVMAVANIMPVWWQWVFLAVATPTIGALPIWVIAGVVATVLRRLALSSQPGGGE